MYQDYNALLLAATSGWYTDLMNSGFFFFSNYLFTFFDQYLPTARETLIIIRRLDFASRSSTFSYFTSKQDHVVVVFLCLDHFP